MKHEGTPLDSSQDVWVRSVEAARPRLESQSVEWLEQQRAIWEKAARDQDATIVELRGHAQRQHESILWLEDERAKWEKAARANEQRLVELQEQLRRLEAFVERMTSTGPHRS